MLPTIITEHAEDTNNISLSKTTYGTSMYFTEATCVTSDQSLGSIIANAIGASKTKKLTNDGKLDNILSNFVTKYVKRICHEKTANVKPNENGFITPVELQPFTEEAFAAVVMVDVSGYSKLTANLAERGSVGAELLAKTMKGYLDQIIDTINNHGGDIVKFAGDAVIVCWRSNQLTDMFDNDQDVGRGELVYKASQCCLRLLTELGTYAIDIKDCDTRTLRIHLGVGAGLMSDVMVGEQGRWEHFIAGEAVQQLAQVLDLAKAELALSHQALKCLGHVIDIRTLNLGNYDKRCIILTGLEKAERKREAEPVEEPELVFKTKEEEDANIALYKHFIDKTALFKLQADVNQSRLFGTDANMSELLNLAELRQITTIFIKIGSLTVNNATELLSEAQSAITIVLEALQKSEGSLRQFHVDDKGAVILCFFGLPPMAHDNDAKLGMRAAVEIRNRFIDIFDVFSMGVTTGVVSYGGVGSAGRAEYAVMGDAINMAARLMCLPDAKEGILCDERTYNLCLADFVFESLGEMKVKGKKYAIPVFRPLSLIVQAEGHSKQEKIPMIGRKSEKESILNIYQQLGQPFTECLFLQGDEGFGLHQLGQYAIEECTAKSINFCLSKPTQLEINTPFLAIGQFLERLVWMTNNLKGDYIDSDSRRNSYTATSDLPLLRRTSTTGRRKQKSRRNELDFDIFVDEEQQTNETQDDTLDIIAQSTKSALQKLDMQENSLDILVWIQQKEDMRAKNLDLLATAPLRIQEITETIVKFVKILSKSKVLLIVSELQWVDILSLEVIHQLSLKCLSLPIILFSRPVKMCERKDAKLIMDLIIQTPRVKTTTLSGFNIDETKQLIMACWDNKMLITVSPKLCQMIHKKTNGTPFFIRSLATAMKDSGQWRITPSGELIALSGDFDFDMLDLGFENQKIILARFDRIDRNLQLFLKVAAVLGNRFALDDVLYFMTGTPNVHSQVDSRTYGQIIRGVLQADRYGFVTLESGSQNGVYFSFKSAVAKKCIYTLMATKQRQQLHLHAAQYFESRMTDENKHTILFPVFEHYMETDDLEKKVAYLHTVAVFYYTNGNCTEAAKYFKLLIPLANDLYTLQRIPPNRLELANWNRELGDSLLARGDPTEAFDALMKSLNLMGQTLPETKYKMKWALKMQISARKQRNAELQKLDTPTKEYKLQDYEKNYKKMHISKNITSIALELQKDWSSPDSKSLLQTARNNLTVCIQHAYLVLSDIYWNSRNFETFCYVIIHGLNLEEVRGPLSSRLLASAAVIFELINESKNPAELYIRAAKILDDRSEFSTSMHVLQEYGTYLYLKGQLNESANALDIACNLARVCNNHTSRFKSQVFYSDILFLTVSRHLALKTAIDTYETGIQRETWYGKFWGAFQTIHYHLLEETSKEELEFKMTAFHAYKKDCPPEEIHQLQSEICYIALLITTPYFMDKEVDLVPLLAQLKETLQKVKFFDWHVSCCFLPIFLGLFTAISQKKVIKGTSQAKAMANICYYINECLKVLKGVVIRDPLRRIFKGIRMLASGKQQAAVKAWKKGLDTHSEAKYLQAVLQTCIGYFGSDEKMKKEGQFLLEDMGCKGFLKVIGA